MKGKCAMTTNKKGQEMFVSARTMHMYVILDI